MKIQSNRLTLRGLYPDLKRALDFRCRSEQTSMEKAVIKMLEKELGTELELAKKTREFSS